MARDAVSILANVLPDRDVRRFCILTNARTGSQLLVRLLDSHPRVRCESEILGTSHLLPYTWVKGRSRLARLRGGAEAYGFKVSSFNLSPELRFAVMKKGFGPVVDELAARDFHPIHLRRKNLLRQVVSQMRGLADERWHARVDDDVRPARLIVDVPVLFASMLRFEEHDTALARILEGRDHTTLWYEDALEQAEDHQATADAVFELLGVPHHPVRSDIRKTSRGGLDLDVENADEVATALRATRFAAFVDM
jgi:hypothetical protein